MKENSEDTIAALSTPPGEGGIAVIRISGEYSLSIVSEFFHSRKNKNLKKQPSHTIHYGEWTGEEGEVIDKVLVSLFHSPHSYTGEDMVEISCHGGIFLTRKILESLLQAGARSAGPGEFTKRAFLHGKIDLTQVEAVLDLIRARSGASLKTAALQLQGVLSQKINGLKNQLLKISAHLEAEIDFPDERLPVDERHEILRQMTEIEKEMSDLVAGFERGARLREGILTVIVGRPNVGKSSLLNILLQKDRALVSELPGTTRDALEEELQIGARGLRLVDTAGICQKQDNLLDRLAMERTGRYLAEGDLFLLVVDGSSEWTEEDQEILKGLKEKDFVLVVNKTDLPQKLNLKELGFETNGTPVCLVSCKIGSGLTDLEKKIEEKISGNQTFQESATLTRLRHKQALENSLKTFQQAREGIKKEISSELVLMDLKSAIDSLKELIGEIYSEDLLDVIFREFCIGK
jgi:tRNA modification GTPase